MTKNKIISLLAYEIDATNIKVEHSDLTHNLIQRLNSQKEKAGERRMRLSSESFDEDILTDYSINASRPYVWGVMWRIAPSKDMPNIPEGLFNNEKIMTHDIKSEDGKENLLQRKDVYYFAIDNKYLVTNLPKTRIKSLQNYFNWFLEVLRGDKLYSFTPVIEIPEVPSLSDVKNIVIGGTPIYKGTKEKEENTGVTNKVCNFALEKLKGLVNEMPDLKILMEKNILSARLVINFRKPKKMEDEEYKRMLGTVMKPIGDEEGIALKLKNGKKISGKDILLSKIVEVELLDNGIINEIALKEEMEAFLKMLGERK